MDSLFEYLIKMAICLVVLFLFYWVFLRKSTHFRLNRFIIMLSVVSSMFLPLIADQIRLPDSSRKIMVIDFSTHSGSPATLSALNSSLTTGSDYSPLQLLGFIYFAGVAIILARLIYQGIYLHAVSRLSKTSVYKGFRIISLDTEMIPFSYFNRIFIPADRINESALESVITHEKSHLSQGHYIDLFIIQIVTILQWFNPFIWLFEKSLKETHEYLADEAVLHSGKDMGSYQAILVNEALGGPVFILTNQLNKSLIKKRIIMMKNVKSPKNSQLKALLIVPLLAGLLLVFANPPLISQTGKNDLVITGNVTDRFSDSPIVGANLVIRGTNIGTITDLQGNYKIIVNSIRDTINVSVTGYRTQMFTVGENTRINVQMEPDILSIDFSAANSFEIIEKPSVHKNTQQGAGEEFVFTEELPAYPGGTAALHQFISDNLNYPDALKQAGIKGTVLVMYVISADGKIVHPKIIRGIHHDLDAEALRVTSLIKGWKAASHGGRPVATTVTMPVEFN